MILADNFYVYRYMRENGTPYYVGKGRNNRAYITSKNHYPPKDKSRIEFISTKLNELTAYAIERFWIKVYGRKDLGTGCLRNLTNGGDGIVGLVCNGRLGKHNSEESKQKTRMSLQGRKHTEERKQKISAGNKARGQPWCPARRAAYEAKWGN